MINQEVASLGAKYLMNTYARFPICIVKGEGPWVWDADGKCYIDFIAGIAVCGLGHAHPELIKVLREQSEKLWHCSNLYWIDTQAKLGELLCSASGMDKVFFANSGAEANEAAIKLARKYFWRKNQKRHEIVACFNSFHGRTLGTLSLTGQGKYQEGFEPLIPGVKFAVFNDLDSFFALVDDKTAAVIVEPIQGEGGVNVADPEFLTGLRRLCDEKGVLLIFDEVQCGIGRTGYFLACHRFGVRPDMVTLAKALGGGFPIGALLATEEVASGFMPGDHASTFGGNPLACAVALKVVELINDAGFLEKVQALGELAQERLRTIAAKDSRILKVKGQGLMIGIEFDREVKGLVEMCLNNGLLVLSAGPCVLRILPPLNISREVLLEGLEILERTLMVWNAVS